MNQYGTLVGLYDCDTCGREFTVCPDPQQEEGWENCLAPDCDSYDPSRDADKYFEDSDTTIEKGPSPRCN